LNAKNEQIRVLQAELAAERQHSREQAGKVATLADAAQRLHDGTIQQQLTDGSKGEIEPELMPRRFLRRLFKRDLK